MLAQGAGMGVALVAAVVPAAVRLVRRVDVHVLFPVGRVGELTVTTVVLAFEGFFTCKKQNHIFLN